MKIALLAKRNSIHTVRWANSLSERGHHVNLLSAHPFSTDKYDESVIHHNLKFSPPLGYFLNVFQCKKLLRKIKPDVLNVHYASGYGTLARLTNWHPYVLSVWGSDVYEYPNRSFVNKILLTANLNAADFICSTSQAMLDQTRKFRSGLENFRVVPFGIDVSEFYPLPAKEDECITVGTVKTLEYKYGIDLLLRGFAKTLVNLNKQENSIANKLRLLIVGGGDHRSEYEQMVRDLNISNVTTFVGKVPHDKVAENLNKLDIYVAMSRQESFGVAVLEASACGVPVIVSNVGGLPEVVNDNTTGVIVESESVDQLAESIESLVVNRELRQKMGNAGRHFVEQNYQWSSCVASMVEVLKQNAVHR